MSAHCRESANITNMGIQWTAQGQWSDHERYEWSLPVSSDTKTQQHIRTESNSCPFVKGLID